MENDRQHQRIVILGAGGSGKSTFAQKLHQKTGIPLIHLDTIHWQNDGTRMSIKEFDSRLQKILNQNNWIIDGNYERTLPLRVQHATEVIFLAFPKRIILARVISRYLKQKMGIEPTSAGNPASLHWRFLRFVLSYSNTKTEKTIRKNLTKSAKLTILKNPKEIQSFLLA